MVPGSLEVASFTVLWFLGAVSLLLFNLDLYDSWNTCRSVANDRDVSVPITLAHSIRPS